MALDGDVPGDGERRRGELHVARGGLPIVRHQACGEVGAQRGPCAPARAIAGFLAGVWHHQSVPIGAMRLVDRAASDAMLAVLDAYRHGQLGNLAEQVEGGAARVMRLLDS